MLVKIHLVVMIHKICAKRLAFLHPCYLPSHIHQLYRQRIIKPHNVHHMNRNSNISYKSIHTIIYTSQQSSIESKDTPIWPLIWHMQRDGSDDWLDDVLIERSSKDTTTCNDEQQYKSIFDTASFVVENFISGDVEEEDIGKRSLLRRVDDVNESSKWSDMFAVLYGTSSSSTIHEHNNNKHILSSQSTSQQPVRKRTSKKNRIRTNLKLNVAYRGIDFCGWEDQRHELYKTKDTNETITSNDAVEHIPPSVQGTLVDILHPILKDNDTSTSDKQQKMIDKRYSQFHQKKQQKNNNKPIEIKVAGRTDKGVSAIGQVCRVRTYKEIQNIEWYVTELVNKQMEQSGLGLRIMNVERVGNDFHPSFGATCRSYAYHIDLDDDDGVGGIESNRPRISPSLVPKLDRMLRSLEGKELDYYAMSHGKVKTQTTLCTLHHARAGVVEWNDNSGQMRQAICFELVGNRFLRRMVRILVATTLREAYRDDGSGNDDALLKILASKDRKLRSRAAPPDGLIFVRADF